MAKQSDLEIAYSHVQWAEFQLSRARVGGNKFWISIWEHIREDAYALVNAQKVNNELR